MCFNSENLLNSVRMRAIIFSILVLLSLNIVLAHASITPPDTVDRGFAVKKYYWMYNVPWEWSAEVPVSLLNYYSQRQRPTWKGQYDYYCNFIEKDDKAVQYIAKGLKETVADAKKLYNWTTEQEIMFLVSFLQQMRYVPDSVFGSADYEKYPVETMFDGYGDCEDKAILGGALLKQMGYDVVLVLLLSEDKKRSHMAIAANIPSFDKGTYYNFAGKKYYYIETTFAGWKAGEVPDNWIGYKTVVIPI